MVRAFISIGSNIDPAENIRKAIKLLASYIRVRIVNISTIYRTEPIGRPEQPSYYNGVVAIETDIPPVELKHKVLYCIENDLGRNRSDDTYASRTIDLDLIMYGDFVVKTDELAVPDPQIEERPFLAIPLCQLEPELTIPATGMTIKEIAEKMNIDTMEPLDEYTRDLVKEFL